MVVKLRFAVVGEGPTELSLVSPLQDLCILCGLCKQACAFDAVRETKKSFFIDFYHCISSVWAAEHGLY